MSKQQKSSRPVSWGVQAILASTVGVIWPVITAQSAQASFSTIYNFCALTNCTDGERANGALIQSSDGSLYGTTVAAGANESGTVFKITVDGSLTTLYSFCSEANCTDGFAPGTGLIQGSKGDFFGTTSQGGANGAGTVFKISPSGTLTTLHSFDTTDGEYPNGLVQGTNGEFYGTTSEGGTTGAGTVFKMTSDGELTTLYSFCSQTACVDGSYPNGLIHGPHGDYYGTTSDGGASNHGTVFKVTATGAETAIYSFCAQPNCTDGEYPYGGLVQGGSDLYGTTSAGGSGNFGTAFKITSAGALKTLYSFIETDGASPQAALLRATNGDLYGSLFLGGTGDGTLFKLTPSGRFTKLHTFDGADGYRPGTPLSQDTNGDIYGTTSEGGANGGGTIFRLSLGIAPFVEAQPASAKAGAHVKILGSDLTGATSVTFDGTPATFTVVSASEISTAVPNGAASGVIEVITPNGTLKGNKTFTVKP